MILSKDTLYRVLLLLLIIIIIENFCSRTKYAFMLGGGRNLQRSVPGREIERLVQTNLPFNVDNTFRTIISCAHY